MERTTWELLALAGLALALASPLGAQPQAEPSGYRARASNVALEDIRRSGLLLPISEDQSGVTVPFGFDFPFFGMTTTQTGVTSEGYLLFGSAVGNVPGALPSTTAPNGVIAPLWADFDVRLNPAATIHVQTLGTFPQRRFVAQWSNVPLATDPGSLHTFQVILHEGSGRFEFRYAGALPSGSVGFEDPTGTQGLDLRSLAAGGQSVEVVLGPPNRATLSPRSSTARPGVELLVPLDLSGPLQGLRGLQGKLVVTAETAGAPPLLLRGFSAAALPTAFDQEPALANSGPLEFVLPVVAPHFDAAVSSVDAALVLGGVRVVVPESAPAGARYRLELQEVIAAGESGELTASTAVGYLTVSQAVAPVATLEVLGPNEVVVGAIANYTVRALAADGTPVPGVEIALSSLPSPPIAFSPPSGFSDAAGNLALQVTGTQAGLGVVFASTPGLEPGTRQVIVRDPVEPRFTSQPPLVANVGVRYGYAPTLDPASTPFELEAGPLGLELVGGVLDWVPGPEQVGVHPVRLVVPGSSAVQTFSVEVVPQPPAVAVNAPPQITSTPPSSALFVGDTFMYPVVATDPDGDPLTFRLQQAPAGMVVSSAGVVSWTATSVGEARALVIVSDPSGAIDGQGVILSVSAVPANQPPVVTSPPPTTAVIGSTLVHQVTADDPEDDALQFELIDAPEGMSIDPLTGELSWTPGPELDEVLFPSLPPPSGTFTTIGGQVAQAFNDCFQDPPGALLARLTFPDGARRYETPDPRAYGFGTPTRPGPGGVADGYGDQRDFLWLVVGNGSPSTGLRYDLGGAANRVVVFPTIDHGPLPGESLEHSVYLSNDGISWVLAELQEVYTKGWHPDPEVVADGYVGIYAGAPGTTWRYASVVAGGLAALRNDGDTEIDAIMGLRENGLGVGAPDTRVIVQVTDAAGNHTTQEFVLELLAEPQPQAFPDVLDFGAVELGSRATQETLLRNTGTGTLNLIEATVPGGTEFRAEIAALNGVVPAVEVRFEPSAVGVITSEVTVQTNAGPVLVQVRGEGVSTLQGPRITSRAPRVAFRGQDLTYVAVAEDPVGQGVAWSLLEAPAGASVHPETGALAWDPGTSAETLVSFSLQATDGLGQSAVQAFDVVVLDPSLTVELDRERAAPGENRFEVSVRFSPGLDQRVVSPATQEARVVVIEHTIPPEWEIVSGSLNETLESDVLTAAGRVLTWRIPLAQRTSRYRARTTALPADTQVEITRGTQARIHGLNVSPTQGRWKLLRELPSPASVQTEGLTLSPVTSELLSIAPFERVIRRIDPDAGSATVVPGTLPPSNAPYGIERTAESLWLSTGPSASGQPHTLIELDPDTLALRRQTRTAGIGPNLQGLAIDPATGTRFFASPETERLYVHSWLFGEHSPLNTDFVVGVSADPDTGGRWEVDFALSILTRFDTAGQEVARYPLARTDVSDVFYEADTQDVHVLHGTSGLNPRLDTYSRQGVLLRTTRIDATTPSGTGLARDPSTGDWWIGSGSSLFRLGAQLGDHRPLAPGFPVGASHDPPSGGTWIADLTAGRVYLQDASGAESAAFPLLRPNVTDLFFDPGQGRVQVLHSFPSWVDTYTRDGTRVGSQYLGGVVLSSQADGLVRHPTSGATWVVDTTYQELIRLAPEFGTTIPLAPGLPAGVAYDPPTGGLWVADQSSDRVYRVDASGVEQFSFVPTSPLLGGTNPAGLDYDATTDTLRVLLLGNSTGQLAVFDRGGNYLKGTLITLPGGSAEGIARNANTGETWIANRTGNSLVRYGAQFGSNEVLGPEIGLPQGAAIDASTGDRWLVDSAETVVHYDAAGNVQGSFFAGFQVGSATSISVAAEGSEIWVGDSSGLRVVAFAPDGTFLRRWRLGENASLTGLSVAPDGRVAVADSTLGEAFVYGPDLGQFTDLPAAPTGVGAGAGSLWVCSSQTGTVYRLDGNGNLVASFPTQSSNPEGIAYDATADEVLVVHGATRVLERYAPGGTFLGSVTLAAGIYPYGLTVLGSRVFVSDFYSQVLEVDPSSGATLGSFSTLSFGLSQPSGLSVADNGTDLLVSGAVSGRVYQVSTSGALVADYSTRTFGCYDVRGVAFDGTKVHVVEGTEWRAYRSDPGGLPVVRWAASFQGGVQACTFGPGGNLFASDWLTDEVREYDSSSGALLGSFSARDFGMFEPLGLAFDGTNLLGADQGQRSLFPMAPGGLDQAKIDLVPLGFSAPRGVCFGPGGNLFFVDDLAQVVVEVTSAGSLVSQFSAAEYGALLPTGITADASRLYLTDPNQDLAFVVSPGGLDVQRYPLGPLGVTAPRALAVGPNGTLLLADGVAGSIAEVSTQGVLLSSFSTQRFGCFAPWGLAFDGTNLQAADPDADELFAMAPGGLPVQEILLPVAQASGVTVEGQNLLVTDLVGNALLRVAQDGTVLVTQDLAELGVTNPTGLFLGEDGLVRVCDYGLDRLFLADPAGSRLRDYDLEAIEVEGITGLEFDEVARTLWLSNETSVFEMCLSEEGLHAVSSVELSSYGIPQIAADVAVNRRLDEVYVLLRDGRIEVFQAPSYFAETPGRILLVAPTDASLTKLALEARGHTVDEVRAVPGALASLTRDYAQVWVLENGVGALAEADLERLSEWASERRLEYVVDGLGSAARDRCGMREYVSRVANALQRLGTGGIVVSLGDDSSARVDSLGNQVLGRIGFDLAQGPYLLPRSSVSSSHELVLAGNAPLLLPSLLAETTTHPSVPVGPQANEVVLYPVLSGLYDSASTGPALPDGEAILAAASFDARNALETGPAVVGVVSILDLQPLTQYTVPGGTTTFLATVENVLEEPTRFQFAAEGVLPGFGASFPAELDVPASGQQSFLVSVTTPSAASVDSFTLTLRVDEPNPTFAEVIQRDRATATTRFPPTLLEIPLTLLPPNQAAAAGNPVTLTAQIANPSSATATLTVELGGLAALGVAPITTSVTLAGGASADLPLTFTPVGSPADYWIGARASGDRPELTPGVAQARIELFPPNAAPVARAGADRVFTSLGGPVLVQLDGSGSTDPEGQALSYTWSGPAGLDDPSLVQPQATLPPGEYLFSLVVSDGVLSSGPDTVRIQVGDSTPPVIGPVPNVRVEQQALAGTPVDYVLAVSDDSAGPLSVVCSPPSGSVFPLGTTAVTCTATDATGNSAQTSFLVEVVDTTAPNLIAPADVVVSTFSPLGAVATFPAPQVSDACDATPSVACVPASGSLFPPGDTVVTCTATDASGNQSQTSFTVTVLLVLDGDPPLLTIVNPADGASFTAVDVPALLTYSDPAGGTGVDPGTLSVTLDAVDVSAAFAADSAQATALLQGLAPGSHTLVATVADAAGNTSAPASATFVVDPGAPQLTLVTPQPVVVEQTSLAGTPVTLEVTIADGVDPAPLLTSDAPAVFPLGVTQVTFTGTDAAGNVATLVVPVEVVDTTPPAITPPAPITVEQSALAGTPVGYTATATDVCDAAPTLSYAPPSGSVFPLGTTPVQVTATDASGNQSTASFTVTVQDTTPPLVVATPGDLVLEATGPAGAAVTYAGVDVVDVCDALPVVTCSPASGSTFPLGTTPVQCFATDASGNGAGFSFSVTVQDTTAPILSSLPDLVVEQEGPAGSVVSFAAPGASDLVDPAPVVVCTPASGSVFSAGVTVVTCTATDASGNQSQTSFTVTVQDTTPPVLTALPDLVVEQESPAGSVVGYAPPVASDLVDPAPVVDCAPASGSVFPAGVTVVTCTATDASGNQSQTSFSVTVEDTTPPALSQPANVTVEQADAAGTVVDYPLPTATDAADPAPIVSCLPLSGTSFPLGTTQVTCTATDAAGNQSQTSFAVTVEDTTPPVLGPLPDLVVDTTGPTGAVVSFPDPAVSDVCDATPQVSCAPASGSLFPIGETLVTCTAIDASGNQIQTSFTVTVRPADDDTTPPVLEGLVDVTAEQTSPAGAVVSYPLPTATDDRDPHPVVTCAPPPGTLFPLGSTAIVCTATDAAGNQSSGSFLVTVVDTTPPSLDPTPDVIVEATGPAGAVVSYAQPGATDVCDATPSVVCSPPSGGVFPLGTTLVTCTATDASGNQSSHTFQVIVRDTTPPEFLLDLCQRQDLRVGDGPRDVALVDVDPDGLPDVVTADFRANTLTLRRNLGGGNFGPLEALATGNCPVAVAAGDLDDDGFVDLVVANYGSGDVSILRGTGGGAFAPQVRLETGAQPSDVALADLTGDGLLDLVVSDAALAEVSLWRGDGAGGFTLVGRSSTGTHCPQAVELADATGDGLLDVVAALSPCQGVAGAWTPSEAEATHSDASGGHAFWLPDLPGGPVYVFAGAPRLTEAPDGSLRLRGEIVSSCDPCRRWAVDLRFVPATVSSPKLELRAEHYAPQGPIDPSSWSLYLLDEDHARFTGKGRFCGKSLSLYHRPRDQHFGFQLGVGANGKNLNLGFSGWFGYRGSYCSNRGDVNVDLEALGGGALEVFPNDGTGQLGPRQDLAPGSSFVALAVGDYDADGALDLAAVDRQAARLDVFLRSGASWSLASQLSTSAEPTDVDAADLDGDGALDLLVSEFGANTSGIYRGDGLGGFARSTTLAAHHCPSAVAAADLNADGRLDVATSNYGSDDVTVWLSCVVEDVEVEQATAAGTAVDFVVPGARDLVDPNPTVSCTHAPGTVFPLGETTVTCTASDFSGNTRSVSFVVRVVDTTPPVLSGAQDLVREATAPGGASVSFPSLQLSDVCDAAPQLACSPTSGSVFPLGTTPVTCTATDASGNQALVGFTVTVVDTTPPALTAPADLVVEQATLAGTLVHYALPSATDLVDSHPALSCAPPPGSVFPLGQTLVTCTATDASGNQSQVSFTVTVVDTTPPTLPPLPDLTVEQADLAGTVVGWPAPPSQDACDVAPLVVCQPPAGSAFPLGQTVVTCTATDASGNQTQARFTLEVVDTTAPELACPEALVLAAPVGGQIELSNPELLAWLGSVSASDVCDAAPLVTHDLSAPIPTGTSRAIAFQAEDASGNLGTCVAYVHVVALGITITSPEDGSCHAGAVTVVVETGGAAVPVTFSGTRTFAGTVYPLSGGPTFSEPGAYAVTAHALGQTASVRFTIDPIPPVVTIASPSAAPHPDQPYPLSVYRYVPGRLNKRCQPEPDPESELPIPLEFNAHDDDGIPGGVVETRVTLDGQPLPAGTSELTEQGFCDLGLGVLGQHTLEVEAFDCAGNRGFKRVTFEVALVELEGRVLTIKPESLKGNMGIMTAFVELPRPPTGCPADPNVCDVVAESLRLTSLHSGRSAAPTKIQKAGNGKLVLKFRRQDLADDQGKLGTQFQLQGRFFDATGPSFLLQDEVKKSK